MSLLLSLPFPPSLSIHLTAVSMHAGWRYEAFLEEFERVFSWRAAGLVAEMGRREKILVRVQVTSKVKISM